MSDAKQYEKLTQLGVKVYETPTPHVKPEELRAALLRAGLNESTFNAEFGSATMLILEGKPSLQALDVESALTRLFNIPPSAEGHLIFG